MIKATIIVDTRRKTKNGYPIKIRVRDSERNDKIIPLYTYSQTKKLKQTATIIERNANLIKELKYCNDNKLDFETSLRVIEGGVTEETEIIVLKHKLERLEQSNSVDWIKFIKQIAEEKRLEGKSTQAYEDIIREFKPFQVMKPLRLSDITFEWVSKFIVYKRRTGCNDGGLSYYLRTSSIVWNQAKKRKKTKEDNPFVGHGIKRSKGKELDTYTPEDIKKLFGYESMYTPKNQMYKVTRNIEIFLFQIAIGGHDYADIANLKWTNIHKDRIKFKRFKQRNKNVSNPLVDNKLSEFALSIIDKYGDKESERIFSFIPNPETKKYTMYRSRVGKSLNTVSKKLGIGALATKTPRYIFRTFAGQLLLSDLIIMNIQGHVPEGTTFGYQGNIPYEVQDKEHDKVLDLIF
ncbi:phage integrase SAM-like domain-containing protein [Joostella sp. CR20]|uniref:phage integrase SAM-like domain-containing protein n=1 Tax=Joostella sp. CR20 TaxID=2804312 RepID=UPI00313BFB55